MVVLDTRHGNKKHNKTKYVYVFYVDEDNVVSEVKYNNDDFLKLLKSEFWYFSVNKLKIGKSIYELKDIKSIDHGYRWYNKNYTEPVYMDIEEDSQAFSSFANKL